MNVARRGLLTGSAAGCTAPSVHYWRHQRDDAGYQCRHEHRVTGRPSEGVLRRGGRKNLLEGWFGTHRAPSQRQAPSGLTTSSLMRRA